MNTEVMVRYGKCYPKVIYKFNVNNGVIVSLEVIDKEICRYIDVVCDLRALSGYIYDEFIKDEKDMKKIFPKCECFINVSNINMSMSFNGGRERFVENKDVMRIILNISRSLMRNIPLDLSYCHTDTDSVLGHATLENRDEGVYAHCCFADNKPLSKKERISNSIKELGITKIISNGDVTIVFWDDNTKTIVRRSVHDVKDGYDLEKAILVSYFQKKTGFSKTLSANVLKELCLMSYCNKEGEKK